jgi:hypothetical protein
LRLKDGLYLLALAISVAGSHFMLRAKVMVLEKVRLFAHDTITIPVTHKCICWMVAVHGGYAMLSCFFAVYTTIFVIIVKQECIAIVCRNIIYF